jgi:hypothetical protein
MSYKARSSNLLISAKIQGMVSWFAGLWAGAAGIRVSAALFWRRAAVVGAAVVPGYMVLTVVKPLSSYPVARYALETLESPDKSEGEATGESVDEAAWDICELC